MSGWLSGILEHSTSFLTLISYEINACLTLSSLGVWDIFNHVYDFPIPHNPCSDDLSEKGLSENLNIGISLFFAISYTLYHFFACSSEICVPYFSVNFWDIIVIPSLA